MAGLINELMDNLSEQADRYEELLGLSHEKRDTIIVNDIEQLQKLNHLENILISQTQKLEKKRISITQDMAIVLNQKVDELTVTRIIELIEGQAEQPDLIAIRDRVKKILDELNQINQQNGMLIQNALEYVEYSTNVMRSQMGGPPSNYPGADDYYYDQPGVFDTKN